jgi:glycosyltransferase involved in cell wall biosynthesis
MKVIVQIPCFNEAETLPLVFANMPKQISGINSIELMVIDDGSTDSTQEVARSLGVDHLVCIPGPNRRHLGRTFQVGIEHALALGADIVVNTDGDNQYRSEDIAALVRPIVEGQADLVIGDRRPWFCRDFSLPKRFFQKAGNVLVSLLAGRSVRDAVSGFRAYNRESLLRMNVLTHYTYTLDTLLQAYRKGLRVSWVDISTNPPTRESRLARHPAEMVIRCGLSALRLSTIYQPLRTLSLLSLPPLLASAALLGRFAYFYFFVPAHSAGHVQSVVVGGSLLAIGIVFLVFGALAELLAVNRRLLEDLLTRTRRLQLKG